MCHEYRGDPIANVRPRGWVVYPTSDFKLLDQSIFAQSRVLEKLHPAVITDEDASLVKSSDDQVVKLTVALEDRNDVPLSLPRSPA